MSVVLYTLTIQPDKAYLGPKKLYFFDRENRNKKVDEFKDCDCTFVLSSIVTEDEYYPPAPGSDVGDGS